MGFLNQILFNITQDSSVGLYSDEIDDIFHSKTGAYREALEKFNYPIKKYIKNDKVFILDICFGIGYNSKAFINSFDNDFCIDALDYNKELILISPFINDTINNDILKRNLFYSILNTSINFNELNILYNFINSNENKLYFSSFINEFNSFYEFLRYKYNPLGKYNSNLHNIYYNYISDKNIEGLKKNKYNNSTINYYIGDARKTIFNTNNTYDIVFLDGFSSQKDPTLWTIDFISQVKNKMNENSILVSYSKSTPFRSALLDLGFKVGKTFIDNIDMGTVASLNENYIDNPLSEFDYNLINTRSGITYKDPTLSLSALEILKNREIESFNSNRLSHTQFLKNYKK